MQKEPEIDNESQNKYCQGAPKRFWYHQGMGKRKKRNCWEFHSCERGPGGKLAVEMGSCPAATDPGVDGINGGINGGRCCWTIAGTMCFGHTSGTVAARLGSCLECEFFWLVAEEEDDFTPVLGFRGTSVGKA